MWSPFKPDSDYFPAAQAFMINFIVDDLDHDLPNACEHIVPM